MRRVMGWRGREWRWFAGAFRGAKNNFVHDGKIFDALVIT